MSLAWPGWTQTAARTVRFWYSSSTTRPVVSPSRSAVARLSSAVLSQVSLVRGLGSSWSQPLLANRPSRIVGSGRKFSSRPSDLACAAGGTRFSTLTVTDFTFEADAGDHAVVDRRPPEGLESPSCGCGLPGVANEVVARGARPA